MHYVNVHVSTRFSSNKNKSLNQSNFEIPNLWVKDISHSKQCMKKVFFGKYEYIKVTKGLIHGDNY